MNRTIILAVFVILSTISSFAAKKKGYFIRNTGDTCQVTFRIPVGLFAKAPTYEQLQWNVTYFDDHKQPHTLKPGDAKEYCFEAKSGEVRMFSIKNILHAFNQGSEPAEFIFLHLVEDGKQRVFNYYDYSGYINDNNNSPDPVLRTAPGSIEIVILQKENGELVIMNTDRSL